MDLAEKAREEGDEEQYQNHKFAIDAIAKAIEKEKRLEEGLPGIWRRRNGEKRKNVSADNS